MRRLRAQRSKPVVLTPIFPNVGVQCWYQQQLEELISQASAELFTAVAAAWAKTPPIFHNAHITAAYGDAQPMIDAAGVAFFADDRVLLMERADGAGWAFPGGHVELNETFEQAARREAFEETLYAYNGPLEPYRLQEWRGVRFATYKAEVPASFTPQLNIEHTAYAWVTPLEALDYKLHPGVRRTFEAKTYERLGMDAHGIGVIPAHMVYASEDYDEHGQVKEGAGTLVPDEYVIAMDAPSPTKALQAALVRWGAQTIKRFDLMSKRIANDFVVRNARATQAGMLAQLKKAGFTVAFKPTRRSMEAFKVAVTENVSLIRSIARKYHTDVEQKVWNAVRNGSDLHALSTQLRKAHGVTVRRAALIARDQNAKAKAVIERERQMELGFTRGIWMHSHAGKEPRPTHVEQDGKPYDLARGFFDKDEGEWVHPGQLINCRCTMRPILEGFDD